MAQRLSPLLKACELIVLPLCQNSFQVRFLKFPPWVVTLKVILQRVQCHLLNISPTGTVEVIRCQMFNTLNE